MSKSITTRNGDNGTTNLLDNSRVTKDHLRPDAYGTLDEAGAFIGRARSQSKLDFVRKTITMIQNHLYLLNSELACPDDKRHCLKAFISQTHLDNVEHAIASIESELSLPPTFFLPGQSPISADIDIARTVVRRAERRVIELSRIESLKNELIIPYLNRLSDLLFLLARYEEHANGIPFAHPQIEE